MLPIFEQNFSYGVIEKFETIWMVTQYGYGYVLLSRQGI